MGEPKYKPDQIIVAVYDYELFIGIIVGVEWAEKISEWNMKCGPGYEDPSENEEMWLYSVNAIGRKKTVDLFEDEIRGLLPTPGEKRRDR